MTHQVVPLLAGTTNILFTIRDQTIGISSDWVIIEDAFSSPHMWLREYNYYFRASQWGICIDTNCITHLIACSGP